MNDGTTAVNDASRLTHEWFATIDGCVLDMDGVLYRGNTVIDGVPTFLDALDLAGIRYTMATNNSTNTPQQYVTKLAAMGITVAPEAIVTSGVATATYLRATYPPGTRIYVLGMDALHAAVFADDYFSRADRDAEVVVSGAHFELRYDYLKTACLAIRDGATYVATNADKTFPSEEGLIPGAGAIVAALTAATDVDPIVIGKPSPEMVQSCLRIMGTDARRSLMIGDRLDTDILAGQRAGTQTLLVLTGVSTAADVARTGIHPELTTPTLDPLTALAEQRTEFRST